MMRVSTAVAVIVAAGVGCGAPSVEQAAQRVPDTGATEYYARPVPAVYAAAKQAVARQIATPEWKELRVVHDDPEHGVLVAERRLEGIVPGLRTRDVWSFYVRPKGELTAVTFVIESSDAPSPAVGARSWAKGHSDIFPVMSEVLETSTVRPVEHRPAEPATAHVAADDHAAGSAQAPPPARTRATTASATAVTLDRVHALLNASDEWRRATRRTRVDGADVVIVGEWAQIEVRNGRAAVAFPTYPPPPAYDVARLIRFLDEAGLDVEVLPGTAFRAGR